MKKIKKKVLIADDDPVYREGAREALEWAGHETVVACDGGEAYAALAKESFNGAIIDLTMPVADGISVISRLRSGGPNSYIPVIVVTGHEDAGAVEQAYKAGATSFLTKPVNWTLFTPHVEFVLRTGQVEAELREATAAAAFLSDLKSQMMQAIAYQFQGPIKSIYGISELLRKEAFGPLEPPMYREMAGDMSNAARSLNSAFLSLMNFGKTLTEHLSLDYAKLPARELLVDCLNAMASKAEQRGVTITTQISIAADVQVEGDRALLNQAVRSVLDNAIRLSPRGGNVTVEAGIDEAGGIYVRASDTGPAISAALLAEFSPDASARPSLLAQAENRDVSLKIARILAEAHQGRLDVRSHTSGTNCVQLAIPTKRPAKTAAIATAIPAADHARLVAISEALANEPVIRARWGQTSITSSAASRAET